MHAITQDDRTDVAPVKYRLWVLALLVTIATISQLDRQIINVLLEPIKHEIGSSDSSLGLLSGFFYVICYTLAGVPIARYADRHSRKLAIVGCVAVWSLATIYSGFAKNYAGLAIARMVLAAGEGGFTPICYSLIADIFPARVRTRAISTVAVGVAVGSSISIVMGGTLVEEFGWRTVFILAGLPGLLTIPLVLWALPNRTQLQQTAPGADLTTMQVLSQMLKSPTFRWIAVLAFWGSVTGFGFLGWGPAFLSRVHGLPQHELGLKLGAATLAGMLAGNLSVGALADWLSRYDVRWRPWAAALGLGICFPFGIASVFVSSANASIIAYAVFVYFLSFWPPIAITCVVTIADPRSKALASACLYFFFAVGGAAGPFFIGVVSDLLHDSLGNESLRYALALTVGGVLLASGAAWAAAKPFRRDCERLNVS